MKKIIFILAIVSSSFIDIKAQSISCQELMDYVYNKGNRKDYIETHLLTRSAWLSSIESYTVDNKIVVIAGIKNNGYEKKYIFCDVPSKTWDTFYGNRMLILNETIGEQFREYIFPYQCNCK